MFTKEGTESTEGGRRESRKVGAVWFAGRPGPRAPSTLKVGPLLRTVLTQPEARSAIADPTVFGAYPRL